MTFLLDVKAGQSLSAIAGQLYGNSSVFRDLADTFDIDEFDPEEQLTGRVLEITEELETSIKRNAEQIEGIFNLLDDKRFQDIDLSGIKSPAGLLPQQLVSWLL